MVSTSGVDGAIIEETSNIYLVAYKQMEQEFVGRNKKNTITNKFHKNVTTFTTKTCCYKLVKLLL